MLYNLTMLKKNETLRNINSAAAAAAAAAQLSSAQLSSAQASL